ncbi:carbonic anhydrase [Richelia sinica FACHB-800]|uniref:Carbonic anhydrase n=1 Tax=Richelia sinica FACHB-800 TaxID=1357546 RepID=A0A975T5W7_9NOST|nr:carbonic anhydrase [Richelia sinica]MBD2663716.1 carbonic anhydrase [Richelia sinica FACHB-800]QXE22717.1 carbonic anhydrase [Richelia sinica FACHB-800]
MSKINGFVGRRNFLKLAGMSGLGIAAASVGSICWSPETAIADETIAAKKPQPVSPQEALATLMAGNQRFVAEKRLYPHQSKLRLQETTNGQYPFAAILGCADSRVPVEIIFDQGIGDLFDVRVAGNVASTVAIGSLEYCTAVLGTQLILVLGHAKCGAVHAAVEDKPVPGRISSFVKEIRPAVQKAKPLPGNLEDNAIIANVQYQVNQLEARSIILRNLKQEGKLKIVGGRYDVATGEVTLLT